MKHIHIKLIKGFFALTITVACLFIGQALWQNYAVDMPLDKALSGIEGVEKVTWDNGKKVNSIVEIDVTLGDTANIKNTYDEMTEKIKQTLKEKEYKLAITDSRTPALEQVYYDINNHIQKAVMDGDFPLLSEKVEEKAEKIGASAKIYVDEQNIYLQLSKSGSTLYSITARNTAKIGGDI